MHWPILCLYDLIGLARIKEKEMQKCCRRDQLRANIEKKFRGVPFNHIQTSMNVKVKFPMD